MDGRKVVGSCWGDPALCRYGRERIVGAEAAGQKGVVLAPADLVIARWSSEHRASVDESQCGWQPFEAVGAIQEQRPAVHRSCGLFAP